MTTSRKTLLALAAVALVQTAVLAYMVIGRVQLLRTGREITLPIRPIDPRDLFRGEYVRLGYDTGTDPLRFLEGPGPKPNEVLYVTLEKKEDGAWRTVGTARALPAATGPDRIVLKGRPSRSTWMRYGIESYFVPQGQGPKLEGMARDSKLAVLVAVDKTGNAAIKGLIIDGKLQYEEPLF